MNRSYVGTWQSYKNPATVKRCMWGDNRLPFRFDFDIGAGEIAILKESGEVVETDWADDEHIVSYVAKDQQAYLELLFALEQNSQSAIFQISRNGVSNIWLILLEEISIRRIYWICYHNIRIWN